MYKRQICAPSALPAKLPMAARMPTFRFIAPFLKKLAVAKVVPQADVYKRQPYNILLSIL